MMPRVLNKYRDQIPGDAVYCGRGSPYGNPFVMGRDGDRDTVCDRFEIEVLPTLNVSALRGKDLVCFCAPKRCHCDPILIKAKMVLIDDVCVRAAPILKWAVGKRRDYLRSYFDAKGWKITAIKCA